MTISPPLIPDHEPFNALANRLARQLAASFSYPLPQAEEHIRNFYNEYEQSMPERRRLLREKGVSGEPMTTEEVFWHDDSALVLEIGYRLSGGNTNSLEFLDWRAGCWDALKNGQRVPQPRFYEGPLIERVKAMHAVKARPSDVISVMLDTIPEDVSRERIPVILKVAFPELGYDVVSDVAAVIGRKFWKTRVNILLWWWR